MIWCDVTWHDWSYIMWFESKGYIVGVELYLQSWGYPMIHAKKTHSQNICSICGPHDLAELESFLSWHPWASAIHGHPRYPDRQHPSGTQPGSDFYSPAACYTGASCPSASCWSQSRPSWRWRASFQPSLATGAVKKREGVAFSTQLAKAAVVTLVSHGIVNQHCEAVSTFKSSSRVPLWWDCLRYLMIPDTSGYLWNISGKKNRILWGLISDDLWRFVQGTPADAPMLRCSGQPRPGLCCAQCGDMRCWFAFYCVQSARHLHTSSYGAETSLWHMVISSNQHVHVARSCTYVKPVNFEGFKRFKSVLLLIRSLQAWRRARLDGKISISAALTRFVESSDRRLQEKRTFKKYSYRHRLRN